MELLFHRFFYYLPSLHFVQKRINFSTHRLISPLIFGRGKPHKQVPSFSAYLPMCVHMSTWPVNKLNGANIGRYAWSCGERVEQLLGDDTHIRPSSRCLV